MSMGRLLRVSTRLFTSSTTDPVDMSGESWRTCRATLQASFWWEKPIRPAMQFSPCRCRSFPRDSICWQHHTTGAKPALPSWHPRRRIRPLRRPPQRRCRSRFITDIGTVTIPNAGIHCPISNNREVRMPVGSRSSEDRPETSAPTAGWALPGRHPERESSADGRGRLQSRS